MIDTALIIAAGAGSRLAGEGAEPKPLRKVCGMPLLERTILCAAKAGLKKAVVVVGFEKDKIISFLRKRKWPLEVDFVENPDWRKSNGVSVLAARKKINEDFILMMSDHVFLPPLLSGLVGEGLGGMAAKLAVDRKIGEIFDIADATKVDVQDGLIRDIGKNIASYNAIDTGLFLMSPAIFDALEAVFSRRGDCSLSEGVATLSQERRMGVFEIGPAWWQDVDTPESLKNAEKILLKACRKPSDGVVSRNFNRYVSLFISSRLVKTPVTANQVTFFTTLVGLFSGYCAAQGTYATFLAGAFLFNLASILDGVDGEMSKLRLTDSKLGQWLDTLSDNLTYVVFIVSTVIGVHKRTDLGVPPWLSWAALAGLTGLMVTMFTIMTTATDSGSLIAVQKDFLEGRKKSLITRVLGKVYFVIKRDFFATFFFFLALVDKPHWVLFLIALATNAAWITLCKSRLERR